LIKKGMERAGDFLDPTSWATAYFDEFRSVVAEDRVFINQISGIFLDHWVSSNLEITVVPGEQKRFLEIDIDVPSWLAKEYLIGEVLLNGKNSKNFQSKRGQRNLIRIPIDGKSSKVEVFFSPSVQPKEIGIGDDIRFLSCQILSCNLLSPDSVINLYQAEIQ
jgi:hypothetical protein